MFLPAEADAQHLIKRDEVDCIFIVGRIPRQIKGLLARILTRKLLFILLMNQMTHHLKTVFVLLVPASVLQPKAAC